MFSGFGTIVAAHVVKDKLTGESKCHGLIQFSNEKEKESARSLHQTVVDDHLISVLPSKFPAMIEEKEKKNIKTEGPVTTKSAISFKPRGVQIKK
jgi:RNA recognition motif-containing protein